MCKPRARVPYPSGADSSSCNTGFFSRTTRANRLIINKSSFNTCLSVSHAVTNSSSDSLATVKADLFSTTMWLIDSTTIRLKFMRGPGSSPYAILSHTWNNDNEVTFQEFTSPARDVTHPKYQKITETCRLARERGIPHVWVDSCCIDKTSSAELTEAINSMFRWYKESTVCFTYFEDLAIDCKIDHDLRKCKWFTRGWTLQELVAPKVVEFYDEAWNLIGDKINLLNVLSEITRIDEEVLLDSSSLPNYAVAARMSWAANRQTTREEDLAYCLLGIFDVYLSLIYGEGSNAFIRIQEAIAQVTYDLSLFGWTDQDEQEKRQRYRGILARSPAEFKDCDRFTRSLNWMFPAHEYTITNKGLRLMASLYVREIANREEDSLLGLECWLSGPDSHQLVLIHLTQTPVGYVRHCSDSVTLLSMKDAAKLQREQRGEIYISKTVTPVMSESLTRSSLGGFYVEIHNQTRNRCKIVRKFPCQLWNMRRECFMTGLDNGFSGVLEMSISGDFDTIEKSAGGVPADKKSRHWPSVLIAIRLGGSNKSQLMASILLNREEKDNADIPLDDLFDLMSTMTPTSRNLQFSSDIIKGMIVFPSTPTWNRVKNRHQVTKRAVKVTAIVSGDTDENTPPRYWLVIKVEPA